MAGELVSREQIDGDALDAAQQAFMDFVTFDKGQDLKAALAKAVSAYELAQWQPLHDGHPPAFRDVMVKDGFWRYKPVPVNARQVDLVAPSAKGPMPTRY